MNQLLNLTGLTDMLDAAGRVESGEWVPAAVLAADLPQQHAYVQSPAAMKKAVANTRHGFKKSDHCTANRASSSQ